jgi:hypothetical protein
MTCDVRESTLLSSSKFGYSATVEVFESVDDYLSFYEFQPLHSYVQVISDVIFQRFQYFLDRHQLYDPGLRG